MKGTAALKPKAWIRLKRGVFKDDLAQVDYVEPSQNAVHVKMIPRIDYSRMRGVMRSSADNDKKRKRRPTQKLFDEMKVKDIGGEVTRDGDYFVFEGNRFNQKGFLYKSMPMSAIVSSTINLAIL